MKERLGPSMWIEANAQKIWDVLDEYRRLSIEEWRLMNLRSTAGPYDLQERTLSEMPICKAHLDVFREIGAPKGFRPFHGRVNSELYSELFGTRVKSYHAFLAKTPDKIIDFTAAQFLIRGVCAGERAEKLRDASPELVKILPNGLTVLSGNKVAIQEKLGLEYRVNRIML